MRKLIIGLVRLYQWTVSPFLPPSCRFIPNCSEYALQALHDHGPFQGGWLTAKRLLRCHPLAKPGFDPVPEHSGRRLRRPRPSGGETKAGSRPAAGKSV
jgi:putative membrane protein insertion efficiency factor